VVDAKIEAVAVMDPPTPETEEPRAVPLDPVVAPVVANGAARERHERRRERRAAEMERAIGDGATGDESAADERGGRAQGAERKAGRRQRQGNARPSAPRAKRSATEAPAADIDAADGTAVDGELSPEPSPAGAPGEGKRSTRAAARAKKVQQSASAAMNSDEDNPAMGALNRHLNMLMQQLTTSHRVIGRVAAERDALRQQLAELQGVPIDQIKVTTVGAPSEEEPAPRRAYTHANAEHRRDAPPAKSTRMQFFGGDDIVQVRKHRQYTVMVMLVVIAVGGLIFRHFGWSLPGNVSRDSLATLPYIGAIMQVFLMGWMMFRVVRVGGKGVRWLFPSEEKRKRR
jgi:hypothetical protein